MTEKRYFKREWEEEYYIFDSQTISENEFDEKLEYEDYQAFEDSMQGDEVVNRLNELAEEKEILELQLKSATNEIDKLMNEINILTDTCHDCCKEIREENKELKKRDDLVSSELRDEGNITLEKYNEIVDYLYKEWKKKRDLND